jgi:Asp-tRNA(Asn)/Glu-tRNA(Gln) amidotransferase A subunit family amidase
MYWAHQTATQQRAALLRGEVSSLELLESSIAQLEKIAPYLNPVSSRLYEQAREAALNADKKLARGKGGPLCGLPITIKDSQWLAGERCTHGSFSLQNFVPEQSSLAVERLQAAGAVIFAKSTCPEYCLSGTTDSALYGRTSNPWDISKTSGGSSGGAAALIAAGVGSMALGGDGGGSIRIPAAFCGIIGFKPSFGVVPRKPGFPNWESLVAYGPMTRSVADAKLMFSVLTDSVTRNETSDLTDDSKLTVIVSEDLGFAPVNDDIRAVFKAAINKISAAGNTVKYDNPGLHSSVSTWAITASSDMHKHKDMANHFSPTDTADLGIYAQEFIKFGETFSDIDISDAQLHRERIHAAYMELFRRNRSAILITPTLGCEAFSHGKIHPTTIGAEPITYPWLDWAGFLYDANLTGMPSCSVPMGLGKRGLPVSLHIMGPPGHDAQVLDTALNIEQLLDWKQPSFSVEDIASGGYTHSPSRLDTAGPLAAGISPYIPVV